MILGFHGPCLEVFFSNIWIFQHMGSFLGVRYVSRPELPRKISESYSHVFFSRFCLVKKSVILCLTCVRRILSNPEFRSDSHFGCPECQILVPIPHRYELNRFAEFGGASGVLHGCRNHHRGFWSKSDMSDSHMRYFCSETVIKLRSSD